ncbi:MAG: hypothetical protein Q7V43_00755 [Myxococcales bacterium]|nr:hypothetical protein [Myxococcales bacterium]
MTGSRWGRHLAAAMVTAGSAASAQPAPEAAHREGTVVRVDGDLLVVDLGHDAGLVEGDRVPVLRPLTVRHPITGQALRDRYPLGTLQVYSVGEALSVLRLTGALLRPPAVGDRVVSPALAEATRAATRAATPTTTRATTPAATRAVTPTTAPATTRASTAADEWPVTAVAAATPPTAPPPCAPGVAAEERAVLAVFLATLGQRPAERVARWASYLREHRGSPWTDRIRAEIVSLTSAAPEAPRAPAAPPPPVLRGAPAESLRLGDPALVALQLTGAQVLGGRIGARRPGAESYVMVNLTREGDGFVRGEVPRALVTLEGFEYFVELDVEGGAAVPVVGTAGNPRRVSVEAGPGDAPDPRGRTRIDLRADFADVGSRTIGTRYVAQRFVLIEGDFLQRVDTRALYGYRVGFGVYGGEGLPLASLPGDRVSEPSTVVYGYHELEFALSDFVHLIARGQVGVHRGGLVGGAQARLRIGYEQRTNLVVGGDVLTEVGQKAFFALNFHPHPAVPMLAQGEVFNQSVASGDPMFRVVGQVGWRATRWLTLAARGSYQLRNIQNGGFGAGLSTTFDW